MLGGAHDETRLLESLLADLESGKLPPESLLIVQRLAASKRPGSGDEVSLWRRCLALLSPDAAEAAQAIRERIANGVKGTAMPAFAQVAGGSLTSKQIDVIVNEIRSRWSEHDAADRLNPPSYTPQSSGSVERGGAAYKAYCESCHGRDGRGGSRGSAITNDSFLALVSDQGLRSIVIAGRPELGAPDWRGNVPGRAMSEQEVTDVVSWLASHRVPAPGRPYSVSNDSPR